MGLNKGLQDLATGAEVSAYFDDVLRHVFLPSGRVRYFPLCSWTGDGAFRSSISRERWQVQARRTVDATYLKTSVPATHTPSFTVAPGVRFMPLNDLPTLTAPPERFVVIGGGKTGIDACLWLLEHGVDPDRLTWIVSRDAWLLDRRNTQPAPQFFHDTIGSQAAQLEALAEASSMDELFDRLELVGYLLRLDTAVRPTMFHGATISRPELAQLRRITDVVRRGRVSALEPDRIVLERGSLPTGPDVVHVDCSASAITELRAKPIFDGDLITPQTVRSYQPVFSASFVAHVEAAYDDEAEKNRLCAVVPLPNSTFDFLRMTEAFMLNQFNWSQDKALRAWLGSNRLDGFGKLARGIGEDQPDKLAVLARLRAASVPAMVNLQRLIAESAPA